MHAFTHQYVLYDRNSKSRILRSSKPVCIFSRCKPPIESADRFEDAPTRDQALHQEAGTGLTKQFWPKSSRYPASGVEKMLNQAHCHQQPPILSEGCEMPIELAGKPEVV